MHRVDGPLQRVGVHLAAGHREAVLAQEVKHLALVGKAFALDVAYVVEAGGQPARSRDRRVEVAQRACGGVAGVLQRLPGGFVVVFQRGELHERLAVHLHAALVGDAHRDRADGQRLLEYLLAGHAVAAGRRAHQMAALVGQVHRQAVELVLHHVLERRKPRLQPQLFRTRRPVPQLGDGLGLAHAPQPRQMGVGLEARQHRAAHAPRGGIRQALARLLLQAHQLIVERVPLLVRDGGRIQRVVLICRFVEPIHQLAHSVHRGTSVLSLDSSMSIVVR